MTETEDTEIFMSLEISVRGKQHKVLKIDLNYLKYFLFFGFTGELVWRLTIKGVPFVRGQVGSYSRHCSHKPWQFSLLPVYLLVFSLYSRCSYL